MTDFFDHGQELNTQSDVPLYLQLLDIFKKKIASGQLQPGDILPSELELCSVLSVSRTTVRQTFAALETEGLVERKRGRGTFVSYPKLTRRLSTLYSFSAEMEKMGFDHESETLDFETIRPGPDLMKRLKLENGEQVFKMVRLRKANGEPLMIETVFVPVKICPTLSKNVLDSHSLYSTISQYAGHRPLKAIETYEVTTIDKNEAAVLKTRAGSGAFFVQRISENDAGEVFELVLMLVRGDRCKYEVELKRDNVTFSRRLDEE